MKIRKLFIIALLLLTACQQKQTHPLSSISETTMNRIVIFTEDKDDILNYYSFTDEKVYELKENSSTDELEALIYKPYALAYLFSAHGAGQKIGLTDCQDPFVTIMSNDEVLNKALNAYTDEEIKQAYQKALIQETETLKKR